MTVDFHAHPVSPVFRECIKSLGIDPLEDDGFPLPAWSPEEHIKFMDDAGINLAVLSVPPPHIHNENDSQSCEAARKINIDTAEICRKFPDRFKFVACVPLPCVEGAINEAKFAINELGAIGVKLSTNSSGIYPGNKIFEPFFKTLDELHALVIIHPCRARQRPADVITGKVAAIFEYPADTTRAVLDMMAAKIMTRHENIKFVVPHNGSFLPYMLQRFSGVLGILASLGMMEKIDVADEFKRLYFDIAGDPEPVALEMLLMTADVERILYGSDFPHSPAKIITSKKKHFDANEKYNAIREKIYSSNAEKILERK